MSRIIPKKRLGQVFLKNKIYLSKIIKAASVQAEDIILEIGSGTGILTDALLKANAKVIAVEKDPYLANYLEKKFANNSNLLVIKEDIRDFIKSQFPIPKSQTNSKFPACADLRFAIGFGKARASAGRQILSSKFKVIGNIPYYLTSHLIKLLLELKQKPQTIVLMIQKEVAQRIAAQPPQMSLLAVSVQFYSQPKIIAYVPKSAFSPQPKVDSAIIKLTPYSHPVIARSGILRSRSEQAPQSFFQVVKAGFSQPRKLLISNLKTHLKISKSKLISAFSKCNLPLVIRAQNLSLGDWLRLSSFLTEN